MKIYYAHALNLYGTKQEVRDVQVLKDMGFTVRNPNTDEGMDHFARVIRDECQALAFRALPDGQIPAGIWREIAVARSKRLPIIELPSFYNRELSVPQTRQYLEEAGYR